VKAKMKKEEVSQHSLQVTFKKTLSELKLFSARYPSLATEFDQYVDQVQYIEWCVSRSDPSLLWRTVLDAIDARLQSLLDFFNNIVTQLNTEGNSIEAAERLSLMENITSYILPLFAIIDYPRVRQMTRAGSIEEINQLRSLIRTVSGDATSRFEATEKDLKARVSLLRDEIDKERKLLKAQELALQNLQQLIATQQASISVDIAAKSEIFESLLTDRKVQIESWGKNEEEKALDFLRKIETYYKLAANTTLEGRFEKAANEENFSYRINLSASVVFFCLAIVSVMIETWSKHSLIDRLGADPLFVWLGKISLVLVCIIPASIFASQATKHRKASVWYKTFSIRIATLKPYLSEVDGDYAAELKEIIKSFFMSELDPEAKSDRSQFPDLTVISKVTEQLEKLKSLLK
jgi:hypothetical protein